MEWFDQVREEGTVEIDVIGINDKPSELTLWVMR